MNTSKSETILRFKEWLIAWNKHDIDEVMKLLDEDIIFENWTGEKITGKKNLRRSWAPWFLNHGNFKFIDEDIFFDENEQKLLYMWRLEWPSPLKSFKGKVEIRRGVDVIYFKHGKIIQKHTYTKSSILIEGLPITQ